MKFENLFSPRIDQMEQMEMAAFVRSYRLRRASEITPMITEIPDKKISSKLNASDLQLLKSIGITAKVLKNLRTEVEDDDDNDELFTE
jgi:hypothetical protein